MLPEIDRDPMNLYHVSGVPVNLEDDLTEYGWTIDQAETLERTLIEYDGKVIVTLYMMDEEMEKMRSKPGPRTVLFYDHKKCLHSVRISRAGKELRHVAVSR